MSIKLGNYYKNDFSFDITLGDGETFTMPTSTGYNYDYVVYWGDGEVSPTITTYDDSNRAHTYTSSGTYTVRVPGLIESFYVGSNSAIDTKIVSVNRWGTVGMFKQLNFYGCENLLTLPTESGKLTNVETFNKLFYWCRSLMEIPEGLLWGNTIATVFDNAFSIIDYNLTTIPERLFEGLTQIESLRDIFSSSNSITSIPSGLFNGLINVLDCSELFKYPHSLQFIPEGLFDDFIKVTNFAGAFHLSYNITEIPESLFDNCTEVLYFSSIFRRAEALTLIPSGLFKNCNKVTNFSEVFYECGLVTTVPENLFRSSEVTSYSTSFAHSGLTSIPSNLFVSASKCTSFLRTFKSIDATTIPTSLFSNCVSASDFGQTFMESNIDTIPPGLFDSCSYALDFDYTFADTYITSIPNNLFYNNVNIRNFTSTFKDCISLINIPSNFVNNNDEVTNFSTMFDGCTSLTGSSGELWLNPASASNYTLVAPDYDSGVPTGVNCYTDCTLLTDYAAIPSHWGGLGLSDEYALIYNKFETKPSTVDATAQNTFVETLVSASIWSELDRLFILASHASGVDSLLDWTHPSTVGNVATLINDPSFVVKQGYTGDGSTSYINTNYNPSIDGVRYSAENGSSIGVYSRTQDITSTQYDIGTRNGGDTQIASYIVSYTYNYMNGVNINYANTITTGLSSISAAPYNPTAISKTYKNGVLKASSSLATYNETTGDIYIMCRNDNNFPNFYSKRQYSMAFIGAEINETKQLEFYNAFQTLMTYYGTQV